MLPNKKLLLVFSLLITMSCLAQKPTHNWSGFYIGPNTGISFNKFTVGNDSGRVGFENITNVFVAGVGIVVIPKAIVPEPSGSSKKTSFAGGVQLGYTKQFKEWVAGLEADVNYSSIKTSQDVDALLPRTRLEGEIPYGIHHTTSIHLTESIRAKIGWAKNNSLIYLTSGAAFANVKATVMDYANTTTYGQPPPNIIFPTPATHRFIASTNNQTANFFVTGLTFGAGYEWFFSPNCSLGIEYRHSTLKGNFNVNRTDADTTAIDSRPTYTGHLYVSFSIQTNLQIENPQKQNVKLTTDQVTVRLNIHLAALMHPATRSNKKKSKMG